MGFIRTTEAPYLVPDKSTVFLTLLGTQDYLAQWTGLQTLPHSCSTLPWPLFFLYWPCVPGLHRHLRWEQPSILHVVSNYESFVLFNFHTLALRLILPPPKSHNLVSCAVRVSYFLFLFQFKQFLGHIILWLSVACTVPCYNLYLCGVLGMDVPSYILKVRHEGHNLSLLPYGLPPHYLIFPKDSNFQEETCEGQS